jgi:hypothetical protein
MSKTGDAYLCNKGIKNNCIMKKLMTLLFSFLLLTTVVSAQQSIVKVTPVIDFSENIERDIIVNEFDGNIYITLTMYEQDANGFYTFERSYDNENFVILSKKTFHKDVDYNNKKFTFINKLPLEPASYRVYKYTDDKVSLVREYIYNPSSKSQMAVKD